MFENPAQRLNKFQQVKMLEGEEILTLVTTISTLSVLWSYADEFLQKQFRLGTEDSENILSLCHAIVTLHFSDHNLERLRPMEFNPYNKTTLAEELCMIFSCSYFLYDTFRWKDRGPTSRTMLCHHICAIFAIVNNLARKNWGMHGNMALLVLEGSNPFLHLRRILIGEGLKSDRICLITEWMFVISFVVFRFFYGFQYILLINSADVPNYLAKTAYMLFSISSVFLIRIVLVFKTKFTDEFGKRSQATV